VFLKVSLKLHSIDVSDSNEPTIITHLYDTTEKEIYVLCKEPWV